MSEVFHLWRRTVGYRPLLDGPWLLWGVFLTTAIANNRLDSCQKQYPDEQWQVTCRQIGAMGEEQFK